MSLSQLYGDVEHHSRLAVQKALVDEGIEKEKVERILKKLFGDAAPSGKDLALRLEDNLAQAPGGEERGGGGNRQSGLFGY